MATVHHGRGYSYSIQYHLVWCVKYRHPVLSGEIEEKLKDLLLKIASDNAFTIAEMEIQEDHLHLLLDCSPQHHIPSVVKALKGVSARLLFKEYPGLKKELWGGHLWNPSYFIATGSENTEAQIRAYIRNQKGGTSHVAE